MPAAVGLQATAAVLLPMSTQTQVRHVMSWNDLSHWKLEASSAKGFDAKSTYLTNTEQKLKWLGAVATALGTAFTALERFKIVEPVGWGQVLFALAALCLAMAVAVLVRAWLRPPQTDQVVEARAFGLKVGAGLGAAALLFAGATPLASLFLPEVPTFGLGRRLVLGYEGVPGHTDSLLVSVAGWVDPSASLVLVLTNVAEDTTQCGDEVLARWGVVPSSRGEVEYMARSAVTGAESRRLCLEAREHEDGRTRTITHLVIPGRDPPDSRSDTAEAPPMQ